MIDLRNPKEYAENFLKIRDKKSRLVPLVLKPAQNALYEKIREEHAKGNPIRFVVLKARQLGCSTVIEGLFFADSATTENAVTLIAAHVDDATKHLFEMNKLFYDELPEALKPMRKNSNAQELVFENPTKDPAEKMMRPGLRSRIRCVTAGGKGVGRSFTFRNVHGSEVAFWSDFGGTMLGLMQAVPDDPDTCVILETTANGFNDFKDFWDDAVAGRNGFTPIFLAWYLEPEYSRPVEPGTVWTDYEKELMERVGLTPEQMAWRRWCIKTNCGNSVDRFMQEYPTTPEEAFLTTGRPFFDNKKILLLIAGAKPPERVGFFTYEEEPDGKPTRIEWRDDPKGCVRLWAEPNEGEPYVIGADTAGEGSDCFTMHAISNADGGQVAEYQNHVSEILFARQLWCLGEYYNWALIALETNFGSYAELMLEQWGYPNLYQRQRYDDIRKSYVDAYGFRTDTRTRPTILASLHTVMDETPEGVKSKWTLGEMLYFQYDDNGKPQAAEGEHDDLVMAAAICHFARPQQRYTVTTEPEAKPVKLIDQLKKKGRLRR